MFKQCWLYFLLHLSSPHYLIFLFPWPLLPVALVLEHGEQRHMQRPSYHGVEALLQSGSLQQADDKCPTNISAGHNHREQDCSPYWHFDWTPATGIRSFIFFHQFLHVSLHLTIVYDLLLLISCCVCVGSLCWQDPVPLFLPIILWRRARESHLLLLFTHQSIFFSWSETRYSSNPNRPKTCRSGYITVTNEFIHDPVMLWRSV